MFVKKKLYNVITKEVSNKNFIADLRLNLYNTPSMRFRKSFSLIELLVVLAMIAGITGIMVSNLDNIFASNKQQLASLFVNETVKVPLMAYKINMGDYPSTAEGLSALLVAPTGKERNWCGPYIESIPKDPWQQDYHYTYPGTHNKDRYDIWSEGNPKSKKVIGNW